MIDFKSDANTDRTRRNIKNALKYRLENEYNKTELTTPILKIHGVDSSRFDFITTCKTAIENHKQGNTINDVSIDDNSNKNAITTEAIIQEATTPFRKLLGYDWLYCQMKKLYGKEEAKRLSSLLYDYSLAIHDSTKLDRIYCWSMSSASLAVTGRNFTQLKSAPTKRLQSYIATLCGTMHTISGSGIAGALAVGDFFIVCSKMAMNSNYTLEDIKENKKIIKEIENCYQQFIHDVNDITRSSFESPFTNISVFDKIKLKNMIKDFDWLFNNEYKEEYLIEYIMEMQKIFIDFFDKGDTLSDGLPFRFPICTINFSKKYNSVEDLEFLEWFCQKDIYRYNIFVSEGTKIASCCRLLSNSDMLNVANQSNSFGGVGISLGSHRVISLNLVRLAIISETKEEFYEKLNNLIIDSIKILKAHLEYIKESQKDGLQPFLDNGMISLSRLFSTIGLIGIYECSEILNKKFIFDYDITKEYLEFLNKKVINYGKEYKLHTNIEAVPGEALAIKLANVDKMIFGSNKQPYIMYSNQFLPLWEQSTVLDRIEIDGKYNKLLTGGGITHIQIGEKITPEIAKKLINLSVKSGCDHFALNGVYSQCENNHTSFGNNNICPICKKDIIDKLTRVVGFITSVKNWNKIRREWEFPKRTFNKIDKI